MTIQTDLSGVMAPPGQARGLPNEHYVSKDVFEEEKRAVLFANWSGIGFGKDVPEPGDAMPVDFVGMPLLIVRDRDRSIGVFQNTCRHRGMILVEEPRKIRGAIRCPSAILILEILNYFEGSQAGKFLNLWPCETIGTTYRLIARLLCEPA